MSKKSNTTDFIEKSKNKHGDKYDYSLVDYVNNHIKVKIICHKHNVFEQSPNKHLNGQGCNLCSVGLLINKNKDNFINSSRLIHSDKYDYSLVDYVNNNIKVKIICPIHGEFEQRPKNNLDGYGCYACGDRQKTNAEYILDVKDIHGYKYDYTNTQYTNSKTHIKIICSEHGEFSQEANSHLGGKGCSKCALKYDKSENELKEFIKSLNIDIVENTKKIIPPLELDIYILSLNIAIEYNGLYWHNEQHKSRNYHLNKTELCEKQGIQLIHIFEDEWVYKKDIVKSRLKNILGLTENRIYGRKCVIKEVSSYESKIFLDSNHLQGSVNSKIRVGLFHNDELVSLMVFKNLRENKTDKENNPIDLIRFCNKLDTNVIGGADKLLKYFIKTYKPNEIISYADRRWSQGNLYEKLSFKFIHNSKPNYFYIIGLNRKHKSNYKKQLLSKLGYDINKSESQIMLERGIFRIYDCGLKKYKLSLV